MADNKRTNNKQLIIFQEKVPDMPEGYYSGDKPNQNLRAFIDAHLKSRQECAQFSPQPYLKTIKATKANAVYNMHSFSSKKPFDAIEKYIINFSNEEELVLDPFCGSGGSLYCALKNGRKAIGIDISPAATFISRGFCTPYDPKRFQTIAESIVCELEDKFHHLYSTTCGYCSGKAEIRTVAWSMAFRCPKCLREIPLAEAGSALGHESAKGICPCGEQVRAKDKTNRWVPVRIEYTCKGNCRSKSIKQRTSNGPNEPEKRLFLKDREHILQLEQELKEPVNWFPEFEFPERARVQVLRPRGIISHSQVYSCRNRTVAESLWELILSSPDDIKDCLVFWFTASILSLTLFERDREGGGGYQSGTMYIPYNCKDRVPFNTLRSKISHIVKGLHEVSTLAKPNICISTQDASRLDIIPSNSIDYVFTDPPYGEKVQYWELNCIWEAWLGFNRDWGMKEAVINYQRGLDENHWKSVINKCLSEIFRVLRPGRYLSLCFHGSDAHWTIIQDLCCEIGFIPDQAKEATAIDSIQKSFKQSLQNENNVRKDLVVNFRKPLPGELGLQPLINGNEDSETFRDKVFAIIRNCLSSHPGISKDQIYDEVISLMVRAGTLEQHDFESILSLIAEPAGDDRSIWFLKDDEKLIDYAESNKEDNAAAVIKIFIEGYLKKHPDQEGVHYSDIFEHFIYAVKDKPRRPLAEWLYDYFYKTDQGTFRAPASEEEERLKAEGRSKGTHRRIKRYLAYLGQGLAVPEPERPNDATLAEWIRHCKRSGLFEQGKLLYEKGGLNLDNLPEEIMVGVEEDYQVCVRLLARR